MRATHQPSFRMSVRALQHARVRPICRRIAPAPSRPAQEHRARVICDCLRVRALPPLLVTEARAIASRVVPHAQRPPHELRNLRVGRVQVERHVVREPLLLVGRQLDRVPSHCGRGLHVAHGPLARESRLRRTRGWLLVRVDEGLVEARLVYVDDVVLAVVGHDARSLDASEVAQGAALPSREEENPAHELCEEPKTTLGQGALAARRLAQLPLHGEGLVALEHRSQGGKGPVKQHRALVRDLVLGAHRGGDACADG
mmetsp:Transcript_15559/g.41762  ORF Transcript_15559/g.41762 Transcript_15559/m.41762 type:complete len:257 (+) Transcript_15559:330-1100(+)